MNKLFLILLFHIIFQNALFAQQSPLYFEGEYTSYQPSTYIGKGYIRLFRERTVKTTTIYPYNFSRSNLYHRVLNSCASQYFNWGRFIINDSLYYSFIHNYTILSPFHKNPCTYYTPDTFFYYESSSAPIDFKINDTLSCQEGYYFSNIYWSIDTFGIVNIDKSYYPRMIEMFYISERARRERGSGPIFNQHVPSYICAGEYFDYDQSATDPDGHRLSYHFALPYTSDSIIRSAPGIAFPPYYQVSPAPPYTAARPFGGNVQIDSLTGRITGTPPKAGKFLVGVQVREYDTDGHLLSIINRNMIYNVADCKSKIESKMIADRISPEGVYEIAVCEGNPFSLQNISTDSSLINTYYWQVADKNSVSKNPIFQLPVGDYEGFLVSNPDKPTCTDTAKLRLKVRPHPQADFYWLPTEPQLPDTKLYFKNASQRAVRWSWEFGTGDQSYFRDPIYIYPNQAGQYEVSLSVSDEYACTDTIQKTIHIKTNPKYYLPNAFAPNGVNNGFRGEGMFAGIQNFQLLIFNRWGEKVFGTNDPNEAWNGKKQGTGAVCPAGVYVVWVRFRTEEGEVKEWKQNLLLVE